MKGREKKEDGDDERRKTSNLVTGSALPCSDKLCSDIFRTVTVSRSWITLGLPFMKGILRFGVSFLFSLSLKHRKRAKSSWLDLQHHHLHLLHLLQHLLQHVFSLRVLLSDAESQACALCWWFSRRCCWVPRVRKLRSWSWTLHGTGSRFKLHL